MANDIDPDFTGKVFTALPMDEIFGAPINASCGVQAKAAHETLNFLLQNAFNTDEKGVKEAISLKLTKKIDKSDGTHDVKEVSMPLICCIPIPNVQISHGRVEFDMEVTQSATFKENIDAGGEAEGKIGWGPFSLSLKAKASYSKEQTRKTDTRAKQHVELEFGQSDIPEGMHRMIEYLMADTLETPAPDLPYKAAKPLPSPAPAPTPEPVS